MRVWQAMTVFWATDDQGGQGGEAFDPISRRDQIPMREDVYTMAETAKDDERARKRASGGGGGGATAMRPACNVIEAFGGLTYPTTSQDVLRYAEEQGIEDVLVGAKAVSVREVFRRYPESVFLSRQDIENAVVAAQVVASSEPIQEENA